MLTTSNTYYLEDDITDKMDTNEVRKKYKYRNLVIRELSYREAKIP